MIDQTISHYRITGKLGEGGMGEVYRAHDTKLNREVALKMLPVEFARDAERMARFRREAQLLASLNHPNIATIYGLEESEQRFALAMELVEGETLAERIAKGILPLDEALPAALQIIEALEAAHEKGIIHRDLKPANVKITPEGSVKVLDFGLAKALEGNASGMDLAKSPTISLAATQAGIVLGTAAYMSPEQARGKNADRRADVWSFGAVLYEMLTGQQAFTGETTTDILAAVVRAEPEWDKLPASTPQAISLLLHRCLIKDPRQRLQAIGDARIAIEEYRKDPSGAGSATGAIVMVAPPVRRWLWMAGLLALLVLAMLSVALWQATRPLAAPVARFVITSPRSLLLISHPAVAISADGSKIAMVTVTDGTTRLYIRKREDFQPRPIVGTENSLNPVFSPDGTWVAFMTAGALKKVPVDGGPIVAIADMNDGRSFTWLPDDTIVFSPEATSPLMQVPASGGVPKPLTNLLAEKKERTHRWPSGLPGGKAVIFTVGVFGSPDNYEDAEIDAVVLKTGERKTILKGASMALYAPSGHLVFARNGSLYAVKFDPESLQTQGSPSPVLTGVSGDTTTGAAHYAIANDGTLIYLPGEEQGLSKIAWVDLKGTAQVIDIPPGTFIDPKLSPDGKYAALVISRAPDSDIWILDVARSTLSRFTFGGNNVTPIWSPDSKWVYYSTGESNGPRRTLWRKSADGGSDAQMLARVDGRALLHGTSLDGRYIYFDMFRQKQDKLRGNSDTDIFRIETRKDAKAEAVVEAPFEQSNPALSPTGEWLAYVSNESGREEIFVRSVNASGRWQVSTVGGQEPRWSPDGKELYYRRNNQMVAVPVTIRPSFQLGVPQTLFEGVYNLRTDSGVSYSIHPNGRQFLMVRRASQKNSLDSVHVVLNWTEELKRTVK